MFDRMQYIFEPPVEVMRFPQTWKCKVSDNDGKTLGYFNTGKPRWFDDAVGIKLGEMRRGISEYEIYDSTNVLLGTIRPELEIRGFTKNKVGPSLLKDQARNQIAISDAFLYNRGGLSWTLNRFLSLRQSGLKIRTNDGSILAIIHAARTSQGCQIDIYPCNISQLLVLCLVASLIFE